MKTAKQILQASLRRLKKEGRKVWIKGADYGYLNGFKKAKLLGDDNSIYGYANKLGLGSPEEAKAKADCFCARGLVRKIGGKGHSTNAAMKILARAVPGMEGSTFANARPDDTVIEYNDNKYRRFSQMIEWFERAVKAA